MFAGENTRTVLNTTAVSLQIPLLLFTFICLFPNLSCQPRLSLTTPRRRRGQQQRCLRALTDDAKRNEAEEDAGGGEWLMPLRCWDRGERWNKEIRMRWERKVAADLSLIWRHLWACTGVAAAAQKPCNNWAGCRSSTSGSRSDGDPSEDVRETGSVHQQTGQTTSLCDSPLKKKRTGKRHARI